MISIATATSASLAVGSTNATRAAPYVNRSASAMALREMSRAANATKSNKKLHGKIPLNPALRGKNPWDKVQVDCCGPWTIRYHNEVTGKISSFQIHLLSMVDVCNGWPEFARINSANSIATAKAFDKNWLCRYPRPLECGHDNGKEFLGIEFQELLTSYGIKSKPTTVKNPRANAIVERIC